MHRQQASGSGMIWILVFASIAIGIIGWSLPVVKNVPCSIVINGSCESQQMRISYFHGTLVNCHIPFAALSTTTPCSVTFSSPMTNVPTSVIISNISGVHTFWDQNYYFQSVVTPTTWAGMPSALTEIYGNANIRTIMQESNSGTTPFCALFADVTSPGFSTAILRAQYSNDTVTWSNLFTDTVDTDLSIASIGQAIPGITSIPITSGATVSAIFLRVVGLNGNGVSSPAFTMIYLQCDWFSQGLQPQFSLINVFTTGFQVTFTALIASPVDTPISFSYIATLCLKSSC